MFYRKRVIIVNQETKSIRMYPKDFNQLKGLREQANLTWPKYIQYINALVKKDLNQKVGK